MSRNYLLVSILLLFIGGCSQQLAPAETPLILTQKTTSAVAKETSISKIPVETATPTPFDTSIQTITPTIGPPPDLELTNISITPTTFDQWGQTYYLLGRIRNNTDKTMLLHGPDPLFFRFEFEVWEYEADRAMFDKNLYTHVKYIDEAGLTNIKGQKILNCILYPGEEGIFNYFTNSNPDAEKLIFDERFENYSGPLGIWYTYESFFDTRADLPLNLHPKAENITFIRDQAQLKFEYDIIGTPEKIMDVNYAVLNTWVILYDKNGKIINILYKILNNLEGFSWGKIIHVRGNSIDTAFNYRFERPFELTQEMIDAVDHLEIINEFEEGNICRLGEY
jgi:hypothetical protein